MMMVRRWHSLTTVRVRLVGALLLLGTVRSLELDLPPQVSAELGTRTTLAARFTGISQPFVSWRKGDLLIARWQVGQGSTPQVSDQFQGRLEVNISQASLTFSKNELTDTGIYSLTLDKLDMPEVSSNVNLTVYELISGVRVSLPQTMVKEGDVTLTMRCTQEAGTWERLSWEKDKTTVQPDSRLLLSGDELILQQVVRSDSGRYSCTMENPFSNGTAHGQLIVNYGPDVPTIKVSSPSASDPSQFVLVNSSVNLTCSTSSQPPAMYFWSVGDSEEITVPSNTTLSLPRVQLAQAGTYTCIVVNSKTTRSVRSSIKLNIYELPSGVPNCTMESVGGNVALRFRCDWRGGDPRAALRWEGLNDVIFNYESVEQEVTSPNHLDGTNVTCVADHPAETRTCVIRPGSPQINLSRLVSTDPSGDALVTLTCTVVSNPPTQIRWYKDREKLLPRMEKVEIRPAGAELQIQEFSLVNDTGNYSCFASNPLGSSGESLQLTDPFLSGVLVQRLNSSTVAISWAVRNSDVITTFLIQSLSGSRSSEAWQTLASVGMSEREAVISNLRPDKSLSFRVLPKVGKQDGAASETITVAPSVNSGLSTGAIIGIVLGCAAVVLLIVLILAYVLWQKCRRKDTLKSQKKVAAPTMDPRAAAAPRGDGGGPPPPTLSQSNPHQTLTPPSSLSTRDSQVMEDWDIRSSMMIASPYGISTSNRTLPQRESAPNKIPSSQPSPRNSNRHPSNQTPDLLKARKATMV